MMTNFFKLSRLFLFTNKHFLGVRLPGNILSFYRISRSRSTHKPLAFINYYRGRSLSTFPSILLNTSYYRYYSTTNEGSDDGDDLYKDTHNDPEVKSFQRILNDDFKVVIDDETRKENTYLAESSADTVEEADDSDIEDFLDSGFMGEDADPEEFEIPPYVPPIELKRGKTGVFDLHELVIVLKEENARDLCVISVPPSINYVDYLVLVSGTSPRHIRAMAELMKWLHKRKKSQYDVPLRIEGIETNNWIAMDLGNIALHIFLPPTRQQYDLETLWTVGAEYDDLCRDAEEKYIISKPSLFSVSGSDT
ncbi:uncharacterized protein LOC115215017 [Argonauta hians]